MHDRSPGLDKRLRKELVAQFREEDLALAWEDAELPSGDCPAEGPLEKRFSEALAQARRHGETAFQRFAGELRNRYPYADLPALDAALAGGAGGEPGGASAHLDEYFRSADNRRPILLAVFEEIGDRTRVRIRSCLFPDIMRDWDEPSRRTRARARLPWARRRARPLDSPPDAYGVDLFRTLFGHDTRILERSWQLRIVWKERSGGSGPTREIPWGRLADPRTQTCLLDGDWTITELEAPPVHAETDGVIAVVGDPGLASELRGWWPTEVRELSLEEALRGLLPPLSLVVVGPVVGQTTLEPAEVEALQQEAFARRCPLIVWCGLNPPPGSVPEVVRLERAQPDFGSDGAGTNDVTAHSTNDSQKTGRRDAERKEVVGWLVELLGPLRVPDCLTPEEAFAKAGLDFPESRRRRWMRGAFAEWRVRPAKVSRAMGDLLEWYLKIDRTLQSAHVTGLVEGMLRPRGRPVQVVLASGPSFSGLRYFRERPVKVEAGVAQVTKRPRWAADPADQRKMLKLCFGVKHFDALVAAIGEVSSSGLALVRVNHPTIKLVAPIASLEEAAESIPATLGDDAPRLVTRAHLSAYLDQLEVLAQHLPRSGSRLLVHISILDEDEESLAGFARSSPHFKVSLLAAMSECVPIKDLRQWCDERDVDLDEAQLESLSRLSYEDLVSKLEKLIL